MSNQTRGLIAAAIMCLIYVAFVLAFSLGIGAYLDAAAWVAGTLEPTIGSMRVAFTLAAFGGLTPVVACVAWCAARAVIKDCEERA